MTTAPVEERNQDATIYVGGLDMQVTDAILWELFLQAGPVVNVHMPKDRITAMHQGYGFVEFLSEEDADYAMKVMNMIKLFGKPIRVNKASANQKNLDIGANIFIGNLAPEVDEKLLYDTFSAFGVILQTPKIMRDPDTGNSKGFAFVNYASFDASDAAIEAMNMQYLCNRQITISYAFKKDSKGVRHGSAAERLLAAQNPLSQADKPHQLFADAPPRPGAPMPGVPGVPVGQPLPPMNPAMMLPVPGVIAPPPPPPMGMGMGGYPPNFGGYPPMMGPPGPHRMMPPPPPLGGFGTPAPMHGGPFYGGPHMMPPPPPPMNVPIPPPMPPGMRLPPPPPPISMHSNAPMPPPPPPPAMSSLNANLPPPPPPPGGISGAASSASWKLPPPPPPPT